MALLLLFTLLTTTTAGAQETISGLTYNTAGGYYEIHDAQDLIDLATYVNAGHDASGKTFKQTADIAYAPDALTTDNDGDGNGDSNYTAIGYYDLEEIWDDLDSRIITVMSPFAGHFDGANHVVSGIRLYKGGTEPATDYYQGLFGVIGSDFSTAEVKNVILADTHITGHNFTGGIVGMSYFGTVSLNSLTQ